MSHQVHEIGAGIGEHNVEPQMYVSDEEERYFHLYYSERKAAAEHEQIEAKISRMSEFLDSLKGKQAAIGSGYQKYFYLEIYEPDDTFLFRREKAEVIQRELGLGGYFVIATSRKMTVKDALELYKSQGASEKLFREGKSYLGNKNLKLTMFEAAKAKTFIEFVELIVRCRMYTLLKDELAG